MDESISVKIRIYGRVQGVGYRAWTERGSNQHSDLRAGFEIRTMVRWKRFLKAHRPQSKK